MMCYRGLSSRPSLASERRGHYTDDKAGLKPKENFDSRYKKGLKKNDCDSYLHGSILHEMLYLRSDRLYLLTRHETGSPFRGVKKRYIFLCISPLNLTGKVTWSKGYLTSILPLDLAEKLN